MLTGQSFSRKINRFSLLLLEDGEFYVSECVVECTGFPSGLLKGVMASVPGRLRGELRVCTKSLFFEPDDVRIPIVRLPFKCVEELHGGVSTIELSTASYTTMKPGGRDEPYEFFKGKTSAWSFVLQYAALEDVLPYMQQMLALSRLGVKESRELYDGFLDELDKRQCFDVGCLESPSEERVLFDIRVMLVSQLTKERGTFAMTGSRIYFQPIHNISGSERVKSHPLSRIVAVVRRRSSLQDVGLELFFDMPSKRRKTTGWGSTTAFFVFKTWDDREKAVVRLMDQLGSDDMVSQMLEGRGEYLGKVTKAWQRGTLTNFEYLLYCNIASGRSFNDLAQYPIFPWILKDFKSDVIDLRNPECFRDLSKPVGALNPKRLEMFHARYREMVTMKDETGEEPFLYGTHYSCPGYTLFWLVRSMPAHMLRLQNGKFDAPDRSFTGIEDAWNSVYNSPTDLKELIPEFYSPDSADFLRNSRGLALGCRQNGRPVGDVELPPWASGDIDVFLKVNRDALESEYVSANLHHWIDLIFGVYQRGENALLRNNVFRHITYEGMVDIDAINDPLEKESIEVSIAEFGQCPRQIFSSPHPRRLVCTSIADGSSVLGKLDCGMVTKLQEAVESLETVFDQNGEDGITLDQLDTVGHDCHALTEVATSKDALQYKLLHDSTHMDDPQTSPTRWNTFSMSNLKTSVGSLTETVVNGSKRAGSMLKNSDLAERMQSHWNSLSPRKNPSKSDAASVVEEFDSSITHISLRPGKRDEIALSLENGCVMTLDGGSHKPTGRVTLSRSPISSTGWFDQHVLAAGNDGFIYQWDPETGEFESNRAHSDIISCIECMHPSIVVSASWDRSIKLFEMEQGLARNDEYLKASQIFQSQYGAIWSMKIVSEHLILAGSEEGSVMLFDTRANNMCAHYKICNDYIGGVCTVTDNPMYCIAAADGILRLLDPRKAGEVTISRDLGSPLLCCTEEANILYVGTEKGEVWSWDISDTNESLTK